MYRDVRSENGYCAPDDQQTQAPQYFPCDVILNNQVKDESLPVEDHDISVEECIGLGEAWRGDLDSRD
jgi:hypothetical protein